MDKSTQRPIALLTDFGLTDTFVGVMKGVILSLNPGARIVDLSHGVRPQDTGHGSFLLATSMDYFPKGTVFCVVVDPGVGSDRRPVLVRTADYFFVGPDNGVLWQAAHRNGIRDIFHLDRPDCFLSGISNTFHGRDIFSPVAARLSLGQEPETLGTPVPDLAGLAWPAPRKTGKGLLLSILHMDGFGNICLNLEQADFLSMTAKGFCLEANGRDITLFCNTYAQAPDRTPVLVAASHGYVEIAVKNGNAARMLRARDDDLFLLIPKA